MSDERWATVVHAPGQGWLVDAFVERGEVPLTADRVESAVCPRGKIFLLAQSVLEHPFGLPEPDLHLDLTLCEPDLLETYQRRRKEQAFNQMIERWAASAVLDPKTLLKIASVA